MGFLDKVKATAKNADSKAGEAIDKGKVKSKIYEEENEIKKLITKIGEAYYQSYTDGTDSKADMDAFCKEIDDRKAKIAEYEEEIKRIEEEGKKEREQNRAEAEAASKKESEE